MSTDFSFYLPGSPEKGILLVHGLTGSPVEMMFVGKKLNRMGFTVYAPMLAGHCRDEKTLLATRYEDWIGSVQDALRKLQKKVVSVSAAGICVGGAIALYAAHTTPDVNVDSVAIYSPTLNYDGWNVPFYYPWAKWGVPLFAHIPILRRMGFSEDPPYGIKSDRVRQAAMGAGGGIAGTLPHFPVRALYENYRLNRAMARALPDIKIDTLLVHAREDDVSHPRNAEIIQNLHGGRCHIEWLEDSYHMIHIDQERHKVADMTAEFFGLSGQAEKKAANA